VLIDVSGYGKLQRYGIEPTTWDNFIDNNLEQDMLYIEWTGDFTPENMVNILSPKLAHYGEIIFIMGSHQQSLLEEFSTSILTVNFVTDCSYNSEAWLTELFATYKEENVARRLLMRDPPADPFTMLTKLGGDPTIYRVHRIPYVTEMRVMEHRAMNPGKSSEIREIYAEVFR
jgi:hypothetical protein